MNRFWNLAIDDLPTSWNFGVGLNSLARLTTYRVALNRLAILINVVDVGSLIISRVANVDGLISRFTINRYGWYISWGSRVTGDLAWREVRPGTFGPVTIGNFTSDVINSCVTVDLRYLLRRGHLTIWRRHVDCPRDCLVQVTLVSTLDFLTRWRLSARLNWLSVVDTSLPMFNLDSNVIRVSTSKGNRLWCISLAIFQNPACRDLSFGINGLIRLTTYREVGNHIALVVDVIDIHGLIISRVGDINRLVLLTILNRYRWNIRLGSRVTGMYWYIYSNPVCSIG